MANFTPPDYTFEGEVAYSEMESFLRWLGDNLVTKGGGLEKRHYSVSGYVTDDTPDVIPIVVKIYDSSFAAIFKLRWVNEA